MFCRKRISLGMRFVIPVLPMAQLCSVVGAVLLLLPPSARAVQIHGAPEGLIVHEMAHFFFGAALVFLLFILYRRPIGTGPGWRYFKFSLLFFLVWNIDTVMVHWLSLRLPEDAILGGSRLWHHRLSGPLDWERWLYYLGRFDHLLCVPAMLFLVLSLRAFCAQAEQRLRSPGVQDE